MVQYTGGTKSAYTQYLRSGSQVIYEKTWALPAYTVSIEKSYITAGGRMAVTRQTVSSTTTFTYYGTDHLGSVRATAVFTSAGVFQNSTLHDFEPYGLELPQKDTTSPNTHKYTGQERDDMPSDAGIHYAQDYMHFRAFGTALGRFMKPDTIPGNLANPQSWNLYSYVGGNPVGAHDPTGHMKLSPQGSTQSQIFFCDGLIDVDFFAQIEAITNAENLVSELIANNGVAGNYSVSAQVLAALQNDAVFLEGFVLWLSTPTGLDQYYNMRSDPNTQYTLTFGPLVNPADGHQVYR